MAEALARVLNVNDHEQTRYMCTRMLKLAGFEVIEAATGEEALMQARGRQPDIIVLDVKLPDMSGFEVCRLIKSATETSSICVLQTSATFVTVDKKIEGLESGADAYLTHPFEPAELIATVHALLRIRAAERELRRRADALTEADKRKDEFLAMLAHELRNPLAAITTAMPLLRKYCDEPEKKDRFDGIVAVIERQSRHLARLIDDLLDVSRFSRGMIELRRSTDRSAPAAQRRDRGQPRAVRGARAGARPPAAGRAALDDRRRGAAAAGVLEPARQRVEVFGARHAHPRRDERPRSRRAPLLVRDGARSRHRHRAVGDAARVRAVRAGRSLARAHARRHGHRADAGPAAGRAARRRGDRALRRARPRQRVRGAAAADRGAGRRGGAGGSSAWHARCRSARSWSSRTTPTRARCCRRCSRSRGHRVEVARDGLTGVERALAGRHDLAIVDIGLPGLNGYEVAQRIRAGRSTRPGRRCS